MSSKEVNGFDFELVNDQYYEMKAAVQAVDEIYSRMQPVLTAMAQEGDPDAQAALGWPQQMPNEAVGVPDAVPQQWVDELGSAAVGGGPR